MQSLFTEGTDSAGVRHSRVCMFVCFLLLKVLKVLMKNRF